MKKIEVLPNGFVCVDGIKIGKVTERGMLQIKDKDRRRSLQRGSEYVDVDVLELAAALQATILR